MSLITFVTPQPANGQVGSGPIYVPRAQTITGTVFSDVSGTIYIDQGGDGLNWDSTVTASITGGLGAAIDVDVVAQYFQIRYVNGNTPQTVFRLYADPRDPYGAFLANALPPSSGGAFAILRFNDALGAYQYVGRFDGADPYGAITAAVVYKNLPGKYAAFPVTNAIVSVETLTSTSQHAPAAF